MVFLTIGLILVITIICFYYLLTKDYNYWQKEGIPFIKPKFPFGNLSDMVMMKKTAGETYRDIYNNFKGFAAVGFYKLLKPGILLRDPELIRTVMVKEFNKFPDNDFHIDKDIDPLLANNPFATKNPEWKKIRAIQLPLQTSAKIKLMVPELIKCANKMVAYIKENQEKIYDAKTICGFYASDSVATSAFGLESNSFSKNYHGFAAIANGEMFGSTFWSNLGVLSAMLAPTIGKLLKLRVISKEVEDYFVKVINEAADHRIKNEVQRDDFLQQLINTNEKSLSGKPEYNRLEMAAHCMTFYLNGFETSSILISFVLYELARHPQIQHNVREEIMAFSKDINNFDLTAIQSLTKLDNVFSETLRLHPPIQLITRICRSDSTLVSDQQEFRIKNGMSVIIPIYALHTDPDNFPEPDVFNPDRFNNKSSYKKFTYLPFGEGPRMCVGIRFVNVQVKLAIISILLNFHIRLNENQKEPLKLNPKSTFLHTANGGLWLRFEDYVY